MSGANPWLGLGQRALSAAERSYRAPPPPSTEGDSRTERMRLALRRQGPLPARVLAVHAGVSDSGLVGALLKWDIWHGRIEFDGGHYRWIGEEGP